MQTFDQSLLNLYRRGLVDRDAALHHATSAPALRIELEQVDRTRGNDQSNPASALPALSPPPAGRRTRPVKYRGPPPGALPAAGRAPHAPAGGEAGAGWGAPRATERGRRVARRL